jgi:hypothetical protein
VSSVSLIAAKPDGETVYSSDVANPPPAGGPAVAAGASVSFDAPAGRLVLRMTVNGADGQLDSDDRELVVPDLTAAEVRVATPRVFVARTARDFQTLSKDQNATPVALREFRRTDRLVIRTEAYAPGDAAVTMTSRLLNRQGQKMVDIPVTAPAAGEPSLIDLPLASFAQGEYLLEITAASDGQASATELVAFRVGG